MRLVMKHLLGGVRAVLILTVAIAFFTATGRAQEFRGTISGAVTDPTGAVIPGAQVVVKETRTGTLNKTTSDAAGQFVVPFLLPGDYSVTASASGFQTTEQKVALQSQEHPILSFKLALGSTGTTVTVSAAPPLLDQANASVGQVISTASVADLPLNGRTPAVLTELSVGVITTSAPELVHPFDNNAGNSWSIGGTPSQLSEVLLDGSPDLTLLGALAYSPTEDSVAEVSVRPFDTDASFGHTIGGVINQITKSGTNHYHGTAYEFSQISDIDANTYFDDRTNPVTKLPVTHYNQYGLTVGGPVSIPKIYNGKNKLFFFFAFEGLKDSQPATTFLTVPTAAERSGDFSALLTAGCGTKGYTENASGAAICNGGTAVDPNQLYDPFGSTLNASNVVMRTPIANNQLTSVGTINPIAANYLSLFPQPNNTATTADGLNNYVSNAPSQDTYNNEFGRLDYNLGSRNHLFFDFRHNNRTQTKEQYFSNDAYGPTLLRENFGTTLDDVFTLNPSTILDARFNWTYFDEVHGAVTKALTPTAMGFPAGVTSASSYPQLPCANFSAGATTSLGSCSTNTTTFQNLGDTGSSLDPTTSYQAFVDVVKVLGRHTLKIGFDGRQYRLKVENYGDSSGNFEFSPEFDGNPAATFTPTFGGDLADFELGLPSNGDFNIPAQTQYRSYYVGAFVQDDFRVNDELTLNMGLRFDVNTPFGDKFGRTVNGFDPTATNSASGAPFSPITTTVTEGGTPYSYTISGINALGGLSYPSANGGAPFQTQSGFLSPRFGFSYAPAFFHDKTVFRGGFGIFVQPETLSNLNAAGTYSSSAISNTEGFSATTSYVATTNNFLTNANTLSNPFPNGFVKPSGSSLGASTNLGEAISFLAPNEKDPYSERWDLGAQQSITHSTMLEFLFVGNHAVHLPISSQNINATEKQYLTTNPYRDEALATAYAKSVPNPFAGLLPGTSFNGATTSFADLIVPFPQFGNNAVTEENQTIGQSWFNSAIVHLEQREKHGLTLTANYSFSKLLEADTFLNNEDAKPTERVSPFDHTHHFTVGATYALPFGKGKMFAFGGRRLWDEIFGGYVINTVYQFQTGPPIEFSADIPLQPGETIADIKSQPRNTSPTGSGTPALNTSVFVTGSATACPSSGACNGTQFINGQYSFHYQTLPQTIGSVRADGYNNMDASILKNFNFTEKAYLQLRFETFNTLNHPVFAAPTVSSATSSSFGYITATAANSLPRQIQLGARIVF
ncbi:MAG: carboxypeptidase regulatory-like domain-containing protein [Acidobacteriaceae bacterium]